MDHMTTGVISGLITNAITAAAQPFMRRGLATFKSFSSDHRSPYSDSESSEESLEYYVPPERIILPLLADLRNSLYDGDVPKVTSFLRTADAQTLIRQVIAAQLTKEPQRYNQQLNSQVVSELTYCANLSDSAAERLGPVLLRIIYDATEPMAKFILEKNRKDETLEQSVWMTLLGYHLESIERTNELYQGYNPPKLASFHRFELEYRRLVHEAYCLITPPYARERVQVALDDLYVIPSFNGLDPNGSPTSIPHRDVYNSLTTSLNRTVILGHPGAGKSTLITRLSYDLSGPGDVNTNDHVTRTPLTVVLKDYQQQRDHNIGILEHIHNRSKTSLHVTPPEGAIEYLIASGRAVVLFDGLDELLETHARQEVTAEVEALARKYPQTPIVVTSRRIGYDEARLDPDSFVTLVLSHFDEESVQEYARKWFTLTGSEGSTANGAGDVVEDFMAQSQEVQDLRSNPLMLGLLCNIYQGENYIPRNRPEVYEWCSVMLFEKWDSRRGIKVRIPYRAQLEPALKHLAYWIYSTKGLEQGVERHRLIRRTTEYLLSRQYEDEDEAIAAAEELVEFCEGRAWVFTDVGTTGIGVPLYQFTHQTFLEYFTAGYLARTHRNGMALWASLRQHILRREWDVVAQIAIQILDRQAEGAIDEFLLALLESIDPLRESETTEQLNVLSFAVRCLEFTVPTAQISRRIVQESLEYCLSTSAVDFSSKQSWKVPSRSGVAELIYQLMVVDPQQRPLIGRTIIEYCEQVVETSNRERTLAALYIGLNLSKVAASFLSSDSARLMELPADLSREFAARVVDASAMLAFVNNGLALSLYQNGAISQDQLRVWLNHGSI